VRVEVISEPFEFLLRRSFLKSVLLRQEHHRGRRFAPDVQELAGHAPLATTQRYIQGDTDAKRKVVDL